MKKLGKLDKICAERHRRALTKVVIEWKLEIKEFIPLTIVSKPTLLHHGE